MTLHQRIRIYSWNAEIPKKKLIYQYTVINIFKTHQIILNIY